MPKPDGKKSYLVASKGTRLFVNGQEVKNLVSVEATVLSAIEHPVRTRVTFEVLGNMIVEQDETQLPQA